MLIIPKIIHQVWPDEHPPPVLAALQQSWRDCNPAWEHHFWTHAQLAAFVVAEYPDLQDRVADDPGGILRYLILSRLGGVFVAAGGECLQPIDELLDGASCFLGREPAEGPMTEGSARPQPGLGPWFITAQSGHGFVTAVIDHITGLVRRGVSLPPPATLLAEVHGRYAEPKAVVLAPASVLYPITRTDYRNARHLELAFWERATRDSAMLMHWEGPWSVPAAEPPPGRLRFLIVPGVPEVPGSVPSETARPNIGFDVQGSGEDAPLISCLMVAQVQPERSMLAVTCFLRQTYPNRELIIVTPPGESALEPFVAGLARSDIRLIRAADAGSDLERLRNQAADHASGRYLCRWEADDLHDPQRLELQYHALKAGGAQACALRRCLLWWPDGGRLAVSGGEDWERSLLYDRTAPGISLRAAAEPAAVRDPGREPGRVVRLELARLNIRTLIGERIAGALDVEELWKNAAAQLSGNRYYDVIRELSKRLPIGVPPRQPPRRGVGDRAAFDASVVICTYRRPALLRACLESLLAQRNPFGVFELIVIDNCTSATGKPEADAMAPRFAASDIAFRYVMEPQTGIAAARNRALDEARHPILCFIDDDEQALDSWLGELLRPFSEYNGVDIVTGEVEPDFGDQPRPSWLSDKLLTVFSCHWGFDSEARLLRSGEWIGEGNCAFRRALFAERRFDTKLGRQGGNLMSSEGVVFDQLRRGGAIAYYAPDAKVSHRIHGERLNKQWMLRRMFFQGVSDLVAKRSLGEFCVPTDVTMQLRRVANLNLETLDEPRLKELLKTYYQAGLALGSNMY